MNFWKGRKVSVTGAAGFAGSHLVELLVSQGAAVTAVDDLSRGSRANLAAVAKKIKFLRADVAEAKGAKAACKGQDVVIHAASKVAGVAFNSAHPATMYRAIVRANTHMVEAAVDAKVGRFVYISSACVYPRHCTIPTPESEGFSGEPEPTNAGYGWAKRMGEFETAAACKEFGLKAAIVRPYNLYGPRDHFDPETSHVIAALIRRVMSGETPLRVWGDGKTTRSFFYVDDFTRGVLETAERYAECDPVNLGTDEEVSIKDLAELILKTAGSKAKIEFDASKPSGQPRRNCDTRKAAEKAGFKARIPLSEGLRRTMEWYAKHHETKLNPSHV